MAQIKKKSYIETFGCQMNERDSEIMEQLLTETYSPTHDLDDADIVIINTCSIREKAEQKAFSLLGRLKKLKSVRPSLLIAVVGCVAQQEGQNIITRMPYVDLVMGPQNIYNLPSLIEEISSENKKIVAIEQSPSFVIPPFLPDVDKGPTHKRFVTIMQGCNNYCTYCVVPYTRGREVSRKPEEIIDEVRHLIDNGVKEITLLGQNVNSYGRDFTKADHYNFSQLLRDVADIPGIKRLRFTTSNPRDLTDELTKCFGDIDILCSHFHLPVQSGSDRILAKMNRKYTIDSYMEKVKLLRSYRPDISITTDIIVGFPGETEEDFLATMKLVENVRYHGAFSFKYSDRPQAKSVEFSNKLTEEEKGARLKILQTRIDEIVLERNKEFEGTIQEIMVESQSKESLDKWSGRTNSNHIVHFSSEKKLFPGDLMNVKIIHACEHSLRAEMM